MTEEEKQIIDACTTSLGDAVMSVGRLIELCKQYVPYNQFWQAKSHESVELIGRDAFIKLREIIK